MDPTQLLATAKIAFTNHRDAGNRYHYPEALKNDALSLLNYYSSQELSHQLGISAKSLKNWSEPTKTKAKMPSVFVPISLNENITNVSSPARFAASIILKLPHHLELVLPTTSMKATAQFISCLIKEMSTCSI